MLRFKLLSGLFALLQIVLIGILLGCSTNEKNLAPVTDLSPPQKQLTGEHVVLQGETLYVIAWRYGRDFRELARINKISPPYPIYPGQIIALSPHLVNQHTKTTKHPQIVAKKQVKSIDKKRKRLPIQHKLGYKNGRWVWPTKGKIITRFNQKLGKKSNSNKGIDISGRVGQAVVAARQGQVVYSGSGLRGYGQLIIIKHDDHFLSAYAHNHKLMVKEGDQVKVGQKIAEMGRSGSNRTKLHFEIRRDGKPVNPLSFLAAG